MHYQEFSGLRISAVGVGCYSLAGVYGSKDPGEFSRMIRRAYELGVTFFDTADAYGDGESILGRAVRGFRREIHIATKVGVMEGASISLAPEHLREACEASLRRLDTDYIDLYQVHFDDPKTPVEDVVGALESLVSAGLIRRYGVGHLPAERIARYCEVGRPFSVLMELSGVARVARTQLLPLCRERGLAAIAFSTTGRGILTGTIPAGHRFPASDLRSYDPLFQREQYQSALRVAREFAHLAARHGKTPAQFALAWVLAQPGVVCALTGPSTVAHLEENVGGSGWQIAEGDLAGLDELFAREDAWLDLERRKAVQAILKGPLVADPEAAFADLVYVLETAAATGMCTEEVILPVFQDLLSLKGSLEKGAQAAPVAAQMDSIRRRLAGMLALD